MKPNLEKALKGMNDAEFRELSMNLNVARKLRKMVFDFALETEEVAERLGIQNPEVKAILNGAYPLDIKTVAILDAYEEELIVESENFDSESELEEDSSLDERAEAEEIAFRSDEPQETKEDKEQADETVEIEETTSSDTDKS